jgi:hypothetical protein
MAMSYVSGKASTGYECQHQYFKARHKRAGHGSLAKKIKLGQELPDDKPAETM